MPKECRFICTAYRVRASILATTVSRLLPSNLSIQFRTEKFSNCLSLNSNLELTGISPYSCLKCFRLLCKDRDFRITNSLGLDGGPRRVLSA